MRTYIRVGLRLPLGPFRVGTWQTSDSATGVQDTLRDPRDPAKPMVPASGLAGSLRAHAGAHAVELLGPEAGSDLSASPWWLLGTHVGLASISSRGQTPISRRRRAAASRGFRTAIEAYLGGGTEADLFLYLSSDQDPTLMLGVLKTWRPTIGGGATTGLGDTEVVSISYRTLSLTEPEDLRALTDNEQAGSARIDAILAQKFDSVAPSAPAPPLALQATLSVEDLLTDSKADGWKDHPWLPGSTWKGLLRSRVSYIAACVGLEHCGDDDEDGWEGCGACGVCAAFGSSASGQGYWTFAWSDQPREGVSSRQRTAIDRFTGGARNRALYPEETLPTHELTLTVHWARTPDADDGDLEWVARAVVRALGDLDADVIGLGGRTSSGLGRVSVTELELGERPGPGSRRSFLADHPAGPVQDLSIIRTLPVTETDS